MVKTLYEYMGSLGHPNIQEAVNSGPGGTINDDILETVVEYQKKEGWFEITLDEIMTSIRLYSQRLLVVSSERVGGVYLCIQTSDTYCIVRI